MTEKRNRFVLVLKSVVMILLVAVLASNIYVIYEKNVKHVEQPLVFGYGSAVVLSGSMSDAINVNDFVITHKEENYTTGDVIMFDTGSSFVTHRIADETEEGYITKGDANNTADPDIVKKENISGKVVLVIPKIGQLVSFLKRPMGMMIIVAVVVLLIELPYVIDRIRLKKGGK